MKQTLGVIIFLFISTITGFNQSLYIKTFGKTTDKPIIFLHGGPGYNCANFESTTAQKLADNGFYVIVYDRRGEGRSTDVNAKYNFEETYSDLDNIYTKYKLKKASFIGHSFGGVVAIKYADKHRDKIDDIFLVGAPVSLQETFNTIINSCKKIYADKKDSTNLKYISMLETMDKTSLMYGTYCFGHAMANGFYTPKIPSQEAKEIYAGMRKDTLAKHASKMTIQGPQGFWETEKYTNIDLSSDIKTLKKKGVNIAGLYGKDDGLYSPDQITKLEDLIGKNNVIYLDNCSHNVFIDQQTAFIEAIKSWSK